jgi:alkaline phosphatase
MNSKSLSTMPGCLLLGLLLAVPAWAESPDGWYRNGQELIAERRQGRAERPSARNVILFVGDGMSLATVAASRILEGQLRGESGEENLLYFERFPNVALAKTYNTNRQTPDSAGTMTAMSTGVKSFAGSIAVDPLARRGDCESMAGRELVTILDLASLAGLATGVVTTTRITHATPGALFARVPDRRWESDTGLSPSAAQAGCVDIARQLVEYEIGGGIDVVLGGGRRAFLPLDKSDPEYPDQRGQRSDGRDLIAEWAQRYPDGHFVWNREQFIGLPTRPTGPVLGLFEPSHMQYEHDRADDPAGEPSIGEMTARAIEILSQRGDGFFLMVEGGRIDHAHHVNNAWRALTDTIAFAEAIETAHRLTDDSDTPIIVTADHGHALTFGGYGERGNPIAGLSVQPGDGPPAERLLRDRDGVPLTTLGYASGPGYRAGQRPDFSVVDPGDPDYVQEATVDQWSATHSGEDVPVYATGPGAEALFGVIEQNVIFHAMLQAVPVLKAVADRHASESGRPEWQRIKAASSAESP